MARSYRNISKYEKEILELKEQGLHCEQLVAFYFAYDKSCDIICNIILILSG